MTERKKILHVTQALGGVKTHIKQILKYANTNDFEHYVISTEDEELREICNELNVKYKGITFKRDFSIRYDILALIAIIKYIKKVQPDVVHCHSAKGGFIGRMAARICGKKTIYTPNGLAFISFTGIKRMVFYSLEFIAKKWTDIYLAVSYSEGNRACFELGYDPNVVKVNLNAIPIQSVREKDYNSVKHIGMIARLTYQKNPLLYLEVVNGLKEKYPYVTYSILGAGLHDHLVKEVKAYIHEHHLSNIIEILPWGAASTSDSYLNTVDIFVMTSAFEGLPYSLLEAMHMGIPSVVSKADGNSDVIQNSENGFSCLSDSEFIDRIEQLINNQDLRSKIGRAGKEYISQKHNIINNSASLEQVYFQLIKYNTK